MRVSLFHSKGGVCKTTTTKELAAALTARGLQVLLVDLDPQASLSGLAGVDPALGAPDTTARLLLPDHFPPAPLSRLLVPAPWGGEVIPSSLVLENATLPLANPNTPGAIARLRTGLDRLADERRAVGLPAHAITLIDTPPASNPLSINALTASTDVLIPCPMQHMDVGQLPKTFATISDLRTYGHDLRLIGVLPQRFDKRNNHDRDNLHELQARFGEAPTDGTHYPDRIILPAIPIATAVGEAAERRESLQAYAHASKVARRYRQLAEHVAILHETSPHAPSASIIAR